MGMGLAGRYRRRLTAVGLIASAILIPGCTLPACDLIDDHDLRITGTASYEPGQLPVAKPGDTVTVRASWDYERSFSNPKASHAAFDLDNDGSFETSPPFSGDSQTATTSYDSEGLVQINHLLEVTGFNFYRSDDRSVRTSYVRIDADPSTRENSPPAASFQVTPDPARTGQTTTFQSFSRDFDGRVVRHEWDFDGDGAIDFDYGSNGHATFVYDEPGEYRVILRVTDDLGATDTVDRLLTVIDYHDIEAPSGALAAAAAINPETLALDVTGRRSSSGALTLNGGELVEIGGTASGRFPASQLPIPLQRRNLKVHWAARFNSSMDIASEATNAYGVILFDYPAGGMSCLGFETEAPADEEPSGFFRVIGGAGKGATIRGQGTGTAGFDAEGVSFSGAGKLRRGKPFARLGKNGCPSLRDEVRRRPENSRSAG